MYGGLWGENGIEGNVEREERVHFPLTQVIWEPREASEIFRSALHELVQMGNVFWCNWL